MNMPLHPTWQDIAIRLVLTLIAGGVIGFNRGVRGEVAGLRTTLLVCLAASIAMIQANILLDVAGKTNSSFGVMDLMRMPLGILTGVGFIGGGTILKRGDLITGVTTAATLWVTTTIGLCFGGGQLIVGAVSTILVVAALWMLKWLDMRMPREQRATLVINADPALLPASDLAELVRPVGFRAHFERQSTGPDPRRVQLSFALRWKQPELAGPPLDLLRTLNQRFAVVSFELNSPMRD